MLYGGADLAHGEVPSTGWEVVLRFRAPGLPDLQEPSSNDDLLAASAARVAALVGLRQAGFSYSQVWAPSQGVVLVRVALPLATLRTRAEDMGLELELQAHAGGGFLAFKEERAEHYVNHLKSDYFTASERLRVTLFVIGSTAQWGAAIDVEGLKHAGLLKDSYPVHDRAIRKSLMAHIVSERWWDPTFRPDLNRLKDYFGTRMALYFAFLAFYTRMLVGFSLVSVPIYFMLDPSFPARPLMFFRLCYATGIIFWASYFLKYWKRRNAMLNVKWGTSNFYKDAHCEIRPQYLGTPRPGFYSQGGFVPLDDLSDRRNEVSISSPVAADIDSFMGLIRRHISEDPDFQFQHASTGLTFQDLPSFPYSSKRVLRRRLSLSVLFTLFYTIAMICLNFLLIFYTSEISDKFSRYSWGSAVPGVLTGILIFVCDFGWKQVSNILTQWENHRTNQSHENSDIVKRFAFQFVSSTFHALFCGRRVMRIPIDILTLAMFLRV